MQPAVDRCIAALKASELVRDYHASAPQRLIRQVEIATMLRARGKAEGKYGSLEICVADAICRAHLGCTYEEAVEQAKGPAIPIELLSPAAGACDSLRLRFGSEKGSCEAVGEAPPFRQSQGFSRGRCR